MRSASVVASKTIAILASKCRNGMGLRASALPFKLIDPRQSASLLGKQVMEVLVASSLSPGKNQNYVNRSNELLRMVGLEAWSRAAICSIDDEDDGMLTFLPNRPDGVGHEAISSDATASPLNSSLEAIGNALIEGLKQARSFAGLD